MNINDEISMKINKLADSLLEVNHAYGFGYVTSMLEGVCMYRLTDEAKKAFLEDIEYRLQTRVVNVKGEA